MTANAFAGFSKTNPNPLMMTLGAGSKRQAIGLASGTHETTNYPGFPDSWRDNT